MQRSISPRLWDLPCKLSIPCRTVRGSAVHLLTSAQGDTICVVPLLGPDRGSFWDLDRDGFLVHIKMLSGKEVDLRICADMTVYDMKELFEDKSGILPDLQRFIFAGVQLEDGQLKRLHKVNTTDAKN